jgi:putative ABC transport system permease protein
MKGTFPRTAAKIAVAELRAAPGKFAFTVLSVAIGLGMLTGIRGLSDSFLRSLLGHAREWIAADIQIRLRDPVTPEQQIAVEKLQTRGVRHTLVSESIATVTAEFEPGLETVAVKAVDPSSYPFYGDLQTDPARPFSELLKEDTLVCSPELLDRFHLHPGDSLEVGGATFRIAGVLRSEPDRFAVMPLALKRVLISTAGLARTRLLRHGNRGVYRVLFKLTTTVDPEELRPALHAVFPEGELTDYRANDPGVVDIVRKAASYASLISLIGLLVGGLGVAMALYSHLEQRLEMIAIMKGLGGHSNQILLIFGIQTGIICLCGTILGLAFGVLTQQLLRTQMHRYLPFESSLVWDWRFALNGLIASALCIGLAAFPVLLRTRRVPPSLILRRNAGEVTGRRQWSWSDAIVALVLATGFLVEGAWVSRSWKLGAYFVCAGVLSGACCAAIAWMLVHVLRSALTAIAPWLSIAFRQGAANVCRPGNQAAAVLIALGAGVTCLFAGYLIQGSMTTQLLQWSPMREANLFVANIGAEERVQVGAFIRTQPGVQQFSDPAAFLAMHLLSIDGVPENRLPQEVRQRLSTKNWYATTAASQPAGVSLTKGKWWDSATSEPLIALSASDAAWMHIQPGSVLEFTTGESLVRARIAALHRATGVERLRYELTFSPPALDNLPVIFTAMLLVRPERMLEVERTIGSAFPEVILINLNDVRDILDDLVRQAVSLFRLLAFFVITAGAAALGASVAGTRARRVQEVAVLKTLGARPAQVIWIQVVEFSLLGATGGALGILLGGTLAAVLLRRVLEAESHTTTIGLAALVIVATAAVANLAGWLASFRILRCRPLHVLRED